jgi:FlaG/FlaF family flagellin (archaellin)
MAVDLTGSSVGLFKRLGKLGKEYLRVVTAYGSTLDTSVEAIRAFWATGAEGIVIDGLYSSRNSYKTVHSGWLSALQSIMQNTVVEQVNDDTALPSKNLNAALSELIRQMTSTSDSILRGTSAASTTAYSGNKGDGKIKISFVNGYGDTLQYAYPETIKFLCTTDSTRFGETFSIAGAPKLAITDANWPGGSGATGSLTLFDAATNSYIQNGNFDTWTSPSAAPDSWTVVVGTPGTNIVRDTSTKRSTSYALRFVNDGSTLFKVKQQLSSSLIAANQVLCLNLWAKVSASDSSGVVRFRLVDGSGAVISNDAGTANSFTADTNTGIGTSYTNLSGFFQMPRQLPTSGVFLEITQSVAMASPKTVNLSLIGLTKAIQLYNYGGPFCAGFSSASAHSAGDYFNSAITNTVTNPTWVRASQRWLGMDTMGPQMYFPSVTSAETVADSLLV